MNRTLGLTVCSVPKISLKVELFCCLRIELGARWASPILAVVLQRPSYIKGRGPWQHQCWRCGWFVSMSSAGESSVYGGYEDLARNSRVTTSRADSSSSASPPSCSLHHHHHHLGGFLGPSTTAELSDDELSDLPSCAYAGRNASGGVQQLQYLGVSGQCLDVAPLNLVWMVSG